MRSPFANATPTEQLARVDAVEPFATPNCRAASIFKDFLLLDSMPSTLSSRDDLDPPALALSAAHAARGKKPDLFLLKSDSDDEDNPTPL
jgi:hypothetical protein